MIYPHELDERDDIIDIYAEKVKDLRARIAELEADADRYNKIKLMTFGEFKAIVEERMDGSGKTLDELLDDWVLTI